eukprot:Pgem_evm1s9825
MNFFSVATLVTLASQQVQGHGYMAWPLPRNTNNSPAYTLNGIRNNPSQGSNFRCNGGTNRSNNKQTLVAGQEFTVTFKQTAPHVGDCSLYLSDPDESNKSSPSRFFKLIDWPFCGGSSTATNSPPPSGDQSFTFTVPEGVPACKDCVLRLEWQALHVKVEYFASCADVEVINPKQTHVTSGMIIIPEVGLNHLPLNGNDYRNPYDSRSPQVMVGPPLATYSDGSGGSKPTPPTPPEPPTPEPPVTEPKPPTTKPPTTGELEGEWTCIKESSITNNPTTDAWCASNCIDWQGLYNYPSCSFGDDKQGQMWCTCTKEVELPIQGGYGGVAVHSECDQSGEIRELTTGYYDYSKMQEIFGSMKISHFNIAENYIVILFKGKNFDKKVHFAHENCYEEVLQSGKIKSMIISKV